MDEASSGVVVTTAGWRGVLFLLRMQRLKTSVLNCPFCRVGSRMEEGC